MATDSESEFDAPAPLQHESEEDNATVNTQSTLTESFGISDFQHNLLLKDDNTSDESGLDYESEDDDQDTPRNNDVENSTDLYLGSSSIFERNCFPQQIKISVDLESAEFVLRSLFSEFVALAEKKVELVMAESLEKLLSKSFQRGEDNQLDQLLQALYAVSEHCLTSLLRLLLLWYERQIGEEAQSNCLTRRSNSVQSDFLLERRDLAVEFIFCLTLIEVCKQLIVHPAPEDILVKLEDLAFDHFKPRGNGPNAQNFITVSDLYAELIGELMKTRLNSIKTRFFTSIKSLMSNQEHASHIISLIMGMRFFRVRMKTNHDFETTFQFVDECARFFEKVKEKEVRNAVAGLLVEILLPIAAVAKNEVNINTLIKFVDRVSPQAEAMLNKKKQALAFYPLTTCLLCVSQKKYFLEHWLGFLDKCLTQLKNRDPKMTRVALESLYRLIWVYMVRYKGAESNALTNSRLQTIVSNLFPRARNNLSPRDMPLNIFVKIIHFIAHLRLDFAIKDVIFELLLIPKNSKFAIYPERMNVGLRAFLVIADSLQRDEPPPPMPMGSVNLPSGNISRVKKTFLSTHLTQDMAEQLDIGNYYPQIRKAFDSILRGLDITVGRTLLAITPACKEKDLVELITAERKPKLDLFKTCVAAVPRIIPEDSSRIELLDLLSRLTLHVDEELKGFAVVALSGIIAEFPEWRPDVFYRFMQFVVKEVPDVQPTLIDASLRICMQLISRWKDCVTSKDQSNESTSDLTPDLSDMASCLASLQSIEGFLLTSFCSLRPHTRKLSVACLKEVRALRIALNIYKPESCVWDVMDSAVTSIVDNLPEKALVNEKHILNPMARLDLAWLLERTSPLWAVSYDTIQLDQQTSSNKETYNTSSPDAWAGCIAGFLQQNCLLSKCSVAVDHAWNCVTTRIHNILPYFDQSNPQESVRKSLLTTTKTVAVVNDVYLRQWRNYLVFACCAITQRNNKSQNRPGSSDIFNSNFIETSSLSLSTATSELFKLLIPLLRGENTDIRDTVAIGLGHTNANGLKDLWSELSVFIKEACEKKQENNKRKKKRNDNRLIYVRIFERIAERGVFSDSLFNDPNDKEFIGPNLGEYFDVMKLCLETESDKDPLVRDIKISFANVVHQIIRSTALCNRSCLWKDFQAGLFNMFASWCAPLGAIATSFSKEGYNRDQTDYNILEMSSLRAMCSVICCGRTPKHLLTAESNIYAWLEAMLTSACPAVYEIGCETLRLLLVNNSSTLENESNMDIHDLVCWTIDACYTSTVTSACNGCFLALAAILHDRNLPVSSISLLNLILFNTASPSFQVKETALCLLQVIDKQITNSESINTSSTSITTHNTYIPLQPTYNKTQQALSAELAKSHSYLTLAMFSEVTQRFETAHFSAQQTLLIYLLPWLANIELMDESIIRLSIEDGISYNKDSIPATDCVLNNLFYITIKHSFTHSRGIENVWITLCSVNQSNVKVILNFLMQMCAVASSEPLLPYVKLISTYIARARPECLLQELVCELKNVDCLHSVVEKTQEPTRYRFVSLRKNSTIGLSSSFNGVTHQQPYLVTNPAIPEEPLKILPSPVDEKTNRFSYIPVRHGSQSESKPSGNDTLQSISSTCSPASHATDVASSVNDDDVAGVSSSMAQFNASFNSAKSYYAPLCDLLMEGSSQYSLQRCHAALLLIAELITGDMNIDWVPHLPQVFHTTILGLDHPNPIVYQHCKRVLLNLSISQLHNTDFYQVSKTLLASNVKRDSCLVAFNDSLPIDFSDSHFQLSIGEDEPIQESIFKFIKYISKSSLKPLWCYEDITPRSLTIQSATVLSQFVCYVVQIFNHLIPQAPTLKDLWGQIALHTALSCSNRHYAGRSFQVLRALKLFPSRRELGEIVQRLVDVVNEVGDDVQGYVSEMLLTLEAIVDLLREKYSKTTEVAVVKESATFTCITKQRPTSLMPRDDELQRAFQHSRDNRRLKARSECYHSDSSQMKFRVPLNEDDLTNLCQIFWILASCLESDFEHEFCMAVRLLDKVLDILIFENSDHMNCIAHLLRRINWEDFPGIQTLLIKGLIFQSCTDDTLKLISRLTQFTSFKLVDQMRNRGLFLNVIALLPTMISNYEEPTPFCMQAAENIALECSHLDKSGQQKDTEDRSVFKCLEGVMLGYRRQTYTRDAISWSNDVCKFLIEAFPNAAIRMIPFLIELLERGSSLYVHSVLHVINSLVLNIDLLPSQHRLLNSPTLRVLIRFLQGSHWQPALKVLKDVVFSSSTLSSQPVGRIEKLQSPVVEESIIVKKDLPGRTIEFDFDVKDIPIVGNKPRQPEDVKESSIILINRSGSHSGSVSTPEPQVATKKLSTYQRRTKDRLLSLLSSFGANIPDIIRTNSIVFSETNSEQACALESENTSIRAAESVDHLKAEDTSSTDFHVFHHFDFLDNELEYDTDDDNFNWGVRREHSKSSLECSNLDITTCSANVAASRDSDSSDEESQLSLHVCGSTERTSQYAPSDIGRPDELELSNGAMSRWTSMEMGSYFFLSEYQFSLMWRRHVDCLLTGNISSALPGIFSAFGLLFMTVKTQFVQFFENSYKYFSSEWQQFAQVLSETVNYLQLLECPIVYIDYDALSAVSFTDNLIRQFIEISEHYETFLNKWELAQKFSNFTTSPIQPNDLYLTKFQQKEMSTLFKRLHGQIFLLYKSYSKLCSEMVAIFSSNTAKIKNLSTEVGWVRNEIQECVERFHNGEMQVGSGDFSPTATHVTKEMAVKNIQDCMLSNRINQAVILLYTYRKTFPQSGHLFGESGALDEAFLLQYLWTAHHETRPGVVLISDEQSVLDEKLEQLCNFNVELSAAFSVFDHFHHNTTLSDDSDMINSYL